MYQKSNYLESVKILKEIKKAKKILINCHRSPDPDSIGSALALYQVLKKMGKTVKVICPSEYLFSALNYLEGFKSIKTGVDFHSFEYSDYDLFIALDSAAWYMVSGDKTVKKADIPIVVIDHHRTNEHYGEVNLVDPGTIAVGEILYWVFQDWNVVIDKNIADCLMAAIIGDSGAFKFKGVTARTLKTASLLMQKGADKDKAIFRIYYSEDPKIIEFYGEVLNRSKIDRRNRIFWSAIPFEVFKKLGKPLYAKESSASMFAPVVAGTDFGFIVVELKPNELSISFRARTGVDVSRIAKDLGGGGHAAAAGARLVETEFEEGIKKILKVAVKHAKMHVAVNRKNNFAVSE